MEELVITEEDHFKNLILSWSNKFRRQLEDIEVLIKEEKYDGYSPASGRYIQASKDEVL